MEGMVLHMASLTIQAVERSAQGKGAARKQRESLQVPAVVYGQGQPAQAISVNSKEMTKLVEHGAAGHLITLEVGANKRSVLLKEVQRDALSGKLLHVDFMVVALDKKIHTVVPITVSGELSRKLDRVVVHGAREITVECLPTAIPDHIEFNAENLEIGESLKASQLVLPAGVTLVTEPDTMILAITQPRAAIEAEAEAGTAEPEVVSEKKAAKE
jgi:large subunit ribosomal protein L25